MPYLQLDVPNHYAVEVKRDLARRLGDSYAQIMQTTPELVTVAFRELGEGGVWCCGATVWSSSSHSTPPTRCIVPDAAGRPSGRPPRQRSGKGRNRTGRNADHEPRSEIKSQIVRSDQQREPAAPPFNLAIRSLW